MHSIQTYNGKRASCDSSKSNRGQNTQPVVEDEVEAPIHSNDKNVSIEPSFKNNTSENCVNPSVSSLNKCKSKIHPTTYESASIHEMEQEIKAFNVEKDPQGVGQTLLRTTTGTDTANTAYQRLMDYFSLDEKVDASRNRTLSTFLGMMAFFIAAFSISLVVLVMIQSHPSDNLQRGEEVHELKSIKTVGGTIHSFQGFLSHILSLNSSSLNWFDRSRSSMVTEK